MNEPTHHFDRAGTSYSVSWWSEDNLVRIETVYQDDLEDADDLPIPGEHYAKR